MAQIRDKENELDTLLAQEETWWHQRSRALWLQSGDRNTRFFHMKGNQRRRRNKIDKIQDNSGFTHFETKNIEGTFLDYFKTLFTSQNPSNVMTIVQVVNNKLTEDMKTLLNTPFTPAEVYHFINSMKSLASPNPDGLSVLFYQQYWPIIGQATLTISISASFLKTSLLTLLKITNL